MVLSSTSDTVLNFRKLKQDFSAPSLREGKLLYEKGALLSADIVTWGGETVGIRAKVKGQFNDIHSCQLEVFRVESDIADSQCDCTDGVDCQHIACTLFHLEQHFPELLVQFLQKQEEKRQKKGSVGKTEEKNRQKSVPDIAKSNDSKEAMSHEESVKADESSVSQEKIEASLAFEKKPSSIQQANLFIGTKDIDQSDEIVKEAERKSKEKVREKQEKQQIDEYMRAGQWLSRSIIGSAVLGDMKPIDQAEMILSIGAIGNFQPKQAIEIQVFVKIPGKSKPILIQQPKLFFQALYLEEPLVLGSTRALLVDSSFGEKSSPLCSLLRERGETVEKQDREGKTTKVFTLTYDAIVQFLSLLLEIKQESPHVAHITLVPDFLEKPYEIALQSAVLPSFLIDCMKTPNKAIHVDVAFELPQGRTKLREVKVFPAKRSFLFHGSTLFLIDSSIHIKHLMDLESVSNVLFPEPLFPTFFAYTLPSLERYGKISMTKEVREIMKEVAIEGIGQHATPSIPKAHAKVSAGMDDELVLDISYSYGDSIPFPEIQKEHTIHHLAACCAFLEGNKGKLGVARNFLYERVLAQELAWGMVYEEKRGVYTAKAEKKAIEFFSEVVPTKFQQVEWYFDDKVKEAFLCDKNELKIHIELIHSDASDSFKKSSECRMTLEVHGPIQGISGDKIIESSKSKKYLIDTGRALTSSEGIFGIKTKQLVLCPEELSDFSEFVQDTRLPSFENSLSWNVPLWVVFGLESSAYPHLSLTITKSSEVDNLIRSLSQIQPGERHEPENQEGKKLDAHETRYQLRSYQKEGIAWLQKLRLYGLSGVLADDMGLGKTLQTIVMLAEIHNRKNSTMPRNLIEKGVVNDSISKEHPSLIICPTSLVENWKEEINKFEPHLETLLFFGTPNERKKLVNDISTVDVVITSYGVLQREIELLEKIPFTYIILDEAQTIKNRDTRNARSVKRLQSHFRLVLTGTPIENSLEDIWSLFDFLMPGFLGSFERFSSNYIRLLNKEPERVLTKIRKRIQPFVLRRMKEEVLDDLPPITHQIYYATFKEDEKVLYETYAKKAKQEIEAMVLKDGFDKVRLHVLATISRLKQICCHPQLLVPKQEGVELGEGDEEVSFLEGVVSEIAPLINPVVGASKYELLSELLDMLVSSNRKTVIFSQYTRMLNIIKKDLEIKGVRHLYLDGSTKNRLQLVKQFNEDPSSHIFLVSLKAGGTGLNLVGADTVIHYDPWWNPAVENQATDRVWRMGQKTKVSSYKLIVKGTIEEKIAELQERKRDLIGDLIQSDEETLTSLTYDDVMALFQDLDSVENRHLQKIQTAK